MMLHLDSAVPLAASLQYGRMRSRGKPHDIGQASLRSAKFFVDRLQLSKELTGHSGCVNTLSWDSSSSVLLTGSDDCTLKLWDPLRPSSSSLLQSYNSGHTANIFSAEFVPFTGNKQIVSCAANGLVIHNDLNSSRTNSSQDPIANVFHCHTSLTAQVLTFPTSPFVFLSCSDDGTVHSYDLRESSRHCPEPLDDVCTKHTIITLPGKKKSPMLARRIPILFRAMLSSDSPGVSAMSLDPLDDQKLLIGCSDSYIRLYDLRNTKHPTWEYIPPHLTNDDYGITSIKYDPYAKNEALVSFSRENIYRIKISHTNDHGDGSDTNVAFEHAFDDPTILSVYSGHANEKTMLKQVQILNPSLVASGCDSGNVFIWSRGPVSSHERTSSTMSTNSENILAPASSSIFDHPKFARVMALLHADRSVVNCIVPFESGYGLIASGIDKTIKVFEPTKAEESEEEEIEETETLLDGELRTHAWSQPQKHRPRQQEHPEFHILSPDEMNEVIENNQTGTSRMSFGSIFTVDTTEDEEEHTPTQNQGGASSSSQEATSQDHRPRTVIVPRSLLLSLLLGADIESDDNGEQGESSQQSGSSSSSSDLQGGVSSSNSNENASSHS